MPADPECGFIICESRIGTERIYVINIFAAMLQAGVNESGFIIPDIPVEYAVGD